MSVSGFRIHVPVIKATKPLLRYHNKFDPRTDFQIFPFLLGKGGATTCLADTACLADTTCLADYRRDKWRRLRFNKKVTEI
jgi:hypothetical protein